MKEFIRKILAVFMAAMVMLSTMSFTVDMHYCGDFLVDVSLFKEAKSCGMDKVATTQNCGEKMQKPSCCSDEQILIEGEDELKDTQVNLTLEEQVFLLSFTYSYYTLFQSVAAPSTWFVGHPPPLLDEDLQVLYETFLI